MVCVEIDRAARIMHARITPQEMKILRDKLWDSSATFYINVNNSFDRPNLEVLRKSNSPEFAHRLALAVRTGRTFVTQYGDVSEYSMNKFEGEYGKKLRGPKRPNYERTFSEGQEKRPSPRKYHMRTTSDRNIDAQRENQVRMFNLKNEKFGIQMF